MKKAKVMLMVIAVFGIVGGALAFKAKKFNINTFYACGTVNSQLGCLLTTHLPYTTLEPVTTTILYSKTTSVTDCWLHPSFCIASVKATE